MRIKRILAAAAALILLSAVLGGCGASIKIARVATKFGTALKNQPITSATAEISTSVTTSVQGEETESRFRSVVRSRTDWESGRSYSDVDTTVSVGNADVKQKLQCYSTAEDGNAVRYCHVDGFDLWLRLEDQKRVVDVDPGLIMLLLDKVSQDTTMEVRENAAGGNTHYVLGLRFSAEDIREFAETAGIWIPEELNGCDLKDVSIPVELEIEDKTFLPISLQIKLQGINGSLVQAIAKVFAKGDEVKGLDVRMDDISLLITNFGYGPQDIPMLPKGAAEKALDMEKVKQIQNQ